ncbi:MAG: phage holin family protein [Prevotella sp.]|nr:phage holin family protein [Prevotella sp.]
MIASDKNVENLGQLFSELKRYLTLQREFVLLDAIDKSVRIIAALILGGITFVLVLLVLFYLSFAVVHWLEPLVGVAWAFAIIAAAFLLLLVCIVLLRRPLIERPLVKFLTETLMN